MKQALITIFAVLFLSSALPAADIIGQWIFNADKPLEDASGHNHAIKLRGKAQIVEDESRPPESRNPTRASATSLFLTPSVSFSLIFLKTVSASSVRYPSIAVTS